MSKQQTNLKDLQNIISFQDQTQLTLSKYDATAYPTQAFRFGQLLLLLPSLRTVSSQTIEELFFKKNNNKPSKMVFKFTTKEDNFVFY